MRLKNHLLALPISRRFLIASLMACLVYCITAVFSNGFLHPDEHYQIIEFAGIKQGWNTDNDLAWEYDARIRPALQPSIALVVIKLSNVLGINSPFTQSALLRMLTGLLSVVCIAFFIRCFISGIHAKYRTTFIVLSYFLWFLPMINVRFSSEVWSGLCLLLVIGLVHSEEKLGIQKCLLIGLSSGLGFEFRYQLAFALVGIFFWLLRIRRVPLSSLFYMAAGFLLPVVLCILLDSWFYGEFVIAPLNYFKYNILYDVVSSFGVSPWYYYWEQLLVRPSMLIGIILLLSTIVLCIYMSNNIIVWAFLPFILIHTLIPHKEYRFMFPIFNLLPIMMIHGIQIFEQTFKNNLPKAAVVSILIALGATNMGGLFLSVFKPAENGAVNMAYYISKTYTNNTEMLCFLGNSPYTAGNAKGLTTRFYKPANIRISEFSLGRVLDKNQKIIVLPKGAYRERQTIESLGYTLEKESIPAWLETLNLFYSVYDFQRGLMLYSKSDEKKP